MVESVGRLTSCFVSRVLGIGFRVSGFGYRVSEFGFWVPEFGIRVPGNAREIRRVRVSGFGFRDSGSGIRDSGSGKRTLDPSRAFQIRTERSCEADATRSPFGLYETCQATSSR